MGSASTRSSSRQPCPVCGGTKSRCKVLRGDLGEISLVNCYAASGPDAAVLGGQWRYIRPIAGMPGGVVVPLRQESERRTHPPAPAAKGKAPAKAEPVRDLTADRDALASARERQRLRHQAYQGLVNSLDLGEADRQRLAARGLSEAQIHQLYLLGFRSIEPGYHPAGRGAPGIGPDGRYAGRSGMLIPAVGRDENGEPMLLGFQLAVAAEEQQQGGPKYVWLSRGDAEPEGYLEVATADGIDSTPLFTYAPEGVPVERAVLTDGALKSYVTALRQGVAAAGAPGLSYASSLGQLVGWLRGLQAKNPSLSVCLAPDAGDLSNASILSQLGTVTAVLQREGFDITWLDLGQERGKEDGYDIDEADRLEGTEVEPQELLLRTDASLRRKAQTVLGGRGIRPKEPGEVAEAPFDLSTPRRYEAGKRTEAIRTALAEGYRQILITDPPGAGKSHWVANLTPDELACLGVERILVASNRHFDQGAEFDLPSIRGRGSGLVQRPDGTIRVIPTGCKPAAGEVVTAAPNCLHLDRLARYQQRHLSGLLSGLCSSCPSRDQCDSVQGAFRYDRAAALRERIAVIHPQSLQSNLLVFGEDEDGAAVCRTGLVMDDVSVASFIEARTISPASITLLLADSSIGTQKTVSKLLHRLNALVQPGLEVATALGTTALRKHCEELLDHLAQQRGSYWSDILERETELVNRATAPCQAWLELVIQWARGEAVAWIDKSRLCFCRLNSRGRDVVARAAWVVWMDGTAIPRDIAGLIAGHNESVESALERVLVLRENRLLSGADLKVIQIHGIGGLGYTRGLDERFRLRLTLAALVGSKRLHIEEAAVIDTLKGLEDSGRYGSVQMGWMAESRGSNRAKACRQLVLIGSPRTNLGAAAARFELLYRRPIDITSSATAVWSVMQNDGDTEMVLAAKASSDQAFRRYYQSLLQAEIEQGLGRLRAYRREGEVLECFVLGDVVCPFPVSLVSLADALGEQVAAQVNGLTIRAVEAAAKQLREEGKPVTIATLAAQLGVEESLIDARLTFLPPGKVWLNPISPTTGSGENRVHLADAIKAV